MDSQQWSRVILHQDQVSRLQVDAVVNPGCSRLTTSARTVVVGFATWNSVKCDSVVSKDNWLVVYQLGKCLGNKNVC